MRTAAIFSEHDIADFIGGPFLEVEFTMNSRSLFQPLAGRSGKVSEVLVIKTAVIDTAV
jgi:hypothetical protein